MKSRFVVLITLGFMAPGFTVGATPELELLLMKAQLHIEQHEYSEAIALLSAPAVTVQPSSQAALLLCNAYIGARQFERAERLLAQLEQRQPDHADTQILLAQIDYQRGDSPAAIERLKRSLHLDPNSPHAHYWLGYILYQTGNAEQAFAPLRRAKQLAPSLADQVDYYLGKAAMQQGDTTAARRQFSLILDRTPEGLTADLTRQELGRLPPPTPSATRELLYTSVAWEFDDNALSDPNLAALSPNTTPGVVSGTRLVISGGAVVPLWVATQWQHELTAKLYQAVYVGVNQSETDDMNTTWLHLDTTLSRAINLFGTTSALRFRPIFEWSGIKGGASVGSTESSFAALFSYQVGAALSLFVPESNRTASELSVNLFRERFGTAYRGEDLFRRDLHHGYAITLTQHVRVSDSLDLTAGSSLTVRDALGDNFDLVSPAAFTSCGWHPSSRLLTAVALSAERELHIHDQTFPNDPSTPLDDNPLSPKRRDTIISISAGVQLDLSPSLYTALQGQYLSNASNETLFRFDKRVLSLAVGGKF